VNLDQCQLREFEANVINSKSAGTRVNQSHLLITDKLYTVRTTIYKSHCFTFTHRC